VMHASLVEVGAPNGVHRDGSAQRPSTAVAHDLVQAGAAAPGCGAEKVATRATRVAMAIAMIDLLMEWRTVAFGVM